MSTDDSTVRIPRRIKKLLKLIAAHTDISQRESVRIAVEGYADRFRDIDGISELLDEQ